MVRLSIWKEKKIWALALAVWAGPLSALTQDDLARQGYRVMECVFDQRCVLGQACERAWRDQRWMLSDGEGIAYRVERGGKISRKAILMLDARWKEFSRARAIVTPMREAVASQLTVFDDGGAIQSFQYAASPGAGQFYLGRCTMEAEEASDGAAKTCTLPEMCDDVAGCDDGAVTLSWNDRERMRINDTGVIVTRLKASAALEGLKVGETEWAAQSDAVTLFVSGTDLAGRISHDATTDQVLARFQSLPERDGSVTVDRSFSGQCEGLF